MKTGMVKLSLGLNYAVLPVIAGYLLWISIMGSRSASMRVTALDRAGVLNEEALQEKFPELAKNIRYSVGRWIVEDEQHRAVVAAWLGFVIVVTNVILLQIWVLIHWNAGRHEGAMPEKQDDCQGAG